MCDLEPFDRCQLGILLLECAVALTNYRYDHKLSIRVRAMSVASFCEELWIRQSSSYRTGFREESTFVRVSPVFVWFCVVWLVACSTSPPSGNQVDGLPLVANTGEDRICPAPHQYKCMISTPLIASSSRSFYRNSLWR